MKTPFPNLTRRAAILGTIFAPLSVPQSANARPSVDSVTWRKLGPDDIFQSGDVGSKTDPAIVSLLLRNPRSVTGNWSTLSPAPSFMLGRRVGDLSSPRPDEMSWWRPEAQEPESPPKLRWVQLGDETLRVGDFWASADPNHPEHQGPDCNLQLQAVHPSHYGKPSRTVPLGNGAHWRPIGLA